jgi:hypothetical protein
VQALRLSLVRPMCAACISTKLDVDEADVRRLLARVHDSIHVSSSTGSCPSCNTMTVIYSLGRRD